MAVDQFDLVRAAMALRGRAPSEWDTFVRATREYAAQVVSQMVTCPVDKLPMAQGMAIQAQELAATLLKAPEIYEKTYQARNKNGQVAHTR
jgi:hypothetical protein